MKEKDKNYYMALALKEAEKGQASDEVPVGAVIVLDGKVVARAFNKRKASTAARRTRRSSP